MSDSYLPPIPNNQFEKHVTGFYPPKLAKLQSVTDIICLLQDLNTRLMLIERQREMTHVSLNDIWAFRRDLERTAIARGDAAPLWDYTGDR